MTETSATQADPLAGAADLAKAINGLRRIPAARRAARARQLIDEAKAVLSAVADAGIVEATREPGATWASVAAEIGVSQSAVNKAVSRHRTRSGPA